MKNEILLEELSSAPPLELVESIAYLKGWQIKSHNDDEIAIEIPTCYGDIGMFFMWSEKLGLLQISAILDIHIDTYIYPNVYELLSLINEKMLLGHFSIISGTNLPLYRSSTMIGDSSLIMKEQIHDLIDVTLEESYRYFTAFSEIKKGADAKTALIMAIPECIGNA